MSTHAIRQCPTFRCAACNSVMHQEHGHAMLSCLRCDVIVKIPEDALQALTISCEIIPHRSPVLDRERG